MRLVGFDQASLDIRVERELSITVRPTRPAVGPGEEVEVEIVAVDQLGKPVAAEVALAANDLKTARILFRAIQAPSMRDPVLREHPELLP